MTKKLHIKTPVFESGHLSQKLGKSIYLKMECFHPAFSFKIRGIGWLCQELKSQGYKRLVASSGGNAGLAVAYAGKKLGMPVTVFVPTTTAPVFLERLKVEGANLRVEGDAWDEANQAALKYCAKTNAGFVPPFDDAMIWSGHSTMIDEIVEQCPKPDAVVVAVGGGGLLCGVLEGLERHGWLDIDVFSVETEGAASFAASLEAGKLVVLDSVNTIATSLGTKRVAEGLFEWSLKKKIHPLLVTDKAAVSACREFAKDQRVLVDPGCGAALSVLYDHGKEGPLAAYQSVLVIVCGGAGIALDDLIVD